MDPHPELPVREFYSLSDESVALPGACLWVAFDFANGRKSKPIWMTARAIGDTVGSIPTTQMFVSKDVGEPWVPASKFARFVVDDMPWTPRERARLAELEADGLGAAAARRHVLEFGISRTPEAEAALADAVMAGEGAAER